MANRVTEDEVKGIIDTQVDDIAPFITAANKIVTAVLGTTLEADHLKEIERWLAAHFIAIRDPRVLEQQIGDARDRYALGSLTYSNSSRDVAGLMETPYGKQVLVLDTTGLLNASLNKKPASFEVIG